jgi:hypothetical protein
MSVEVADRAIEASDLQYANQILDVDSDEMLPTGHWPEAFGDIAVELMPFLRGVNQNAAENTLDRDDIESDSMEIFSHLVWNEKARRTPVVGPRPGRPYRFPARPSTVDAVGGMRL